MTGPERLYVTAFDAQAGRSRAEVAVTDGIDPVDVTYGELAHASECVAAGLVRFGLGPGDRLAIALEPSAAYLAVVLGCIRAGVAAAPLNTRLAMPELAGYLDKTKPRLGVFDEAHGGLAGALPAGSVAIEDAHRRLPLVRRLDGIVAEPGGAPRVDERSVALILPTGGTTGVPKAATMLQQALWSSATASSASQFGADAELWCTPRFHVGIAMLPLGVFLSGARLRLLPRFDVDAVVSALADRTQGITGMSVTYTLYRYYSPGLLRVEAAVVPSADAELTAEQVIEFARDRTAGYKLPKQVRFYESLPRTGAGKVDRRFLRVRSSRHD